MRKFHRSCSTSVCLSLYLSLSVSLSVTSVSATNLSYMLSAHEFPSLPTRLALSIPHLWQLSVRSQWVAGAPKGSSLLNLVHKSYPTYVTSQSSLCRYPGEGFCDTKSAGTIKCPAGLCFQFVKWIPNLGYEALK
jgi:hypothetical protein